MAKSLCRNARLNIIGIGNKKGLLKTSPFIVFRRVLCEIHKFAKWHFPQTLTRCIKNGVRQCRGCWGHRGFPDPADFAAIFQSRHMNTGRVENGQVTAMDLGIAMPSVVASQMSRQGISLPGPDAVIVTGAWEQPFDVPNLRVTGYRAKPLAPLSSWRSVGASTNAFFHEGMMDELIRAAGADPLAERLRLCSHEPSRKVLEKVGEMSNWGCLLYTSPSPRDS